MRPVRANRREGDSEREDLALVKMERVLVGHWVGMLVKGERERLGLERAEGEGEPGPEWWTTATEAYREGSEFWQMLMSIVQEIEREQ
jgi:hypothetical protein